VADDDHAGWFRFHRFAQALLKVRCLFHTCSLLDVGLCVGDIRAACSGIAAAQMCFLWAKAEVAIETRQVFRRVGICAAVGLLW
jgi:hypothetical protein